MKLNGWLRLWIFATALWAIVMVGVSIAAIDDPVDHREYIGASRILSQLSDDANRFLRFSRGMHGHGVVEPWFEIPLRFTDGTETIFEFGERPNVKIEFFESTIDYLESKHDEIAELELDEASEAKIVAQIAAARASVQGYLGPFQMGRLDYFESHLDDISEGEGKVLTEFEKARFLDQITSKSIRVQAALAEFELAAQRDSRRNVITIAALLIVVPSSVILILGYGVAWVRLGVVRSLRKLRS